MLMLIMANLKSGRPQASDDWDYYKYDTVKDRSFCQIIVNGVKCNASFAKKILEIYIHICNELIR